MKYIRASRAQIQLPEAVEGLQGREVVDSEGESLGEVVDILIDQFHHEHSFLEIETDGFLGMGKKLLLAPLRLEDAEADPIVVGISKEELRDAPDYEPSMMLSEEYEVALSGYWNLPSFWTKPPAIRDPFMEQAGELRSMRPEQFAGDPHTPHANPRSRQTRDERDH